jgi:hypothetical protein
MNTAWNFEERLRDAKAKRDEVERTNRINHLSESIKWAVVCGTKEEERVKTENMLNKRY